MEIEIDSNSGFCFGVQRAVDMAEKSLAEGKPVYCLGEIVHNHEEVKRLEAKGLKTITHEDLPRITGSKVLIRAHGEPPSTFNSLGNNALDNGTCPIVAGIQKKVKAAWEETKKSGGTVVIFGKKGHAEVIGLAGQTNGEAAVVASISDLDNIDFSNPIVLFAQTTMGVDRYKEIANEIRSRMAAFFSTEAIPLTIHNSICGHVSNRGEKLKSFVYKHDTIIFVAGLNSSNGKVLYEVCRQANSNTHWVPDVQSLEKEWFTDSKSVGICGATSTPPWLMQEVADQIKKLTGK
ncbi:MAG TPA: 4-hydroxy-3-methylbut-2-enyl diphosphate reductase [Bacteroidales bacterium]|nr:4-hydroxy-3-methylbut-2-enyl diphosphate reductase [Bacteroidales bacterium]